MPRRADRSAARASARLSQDVIITAAVELADRDGLTALSMRRLAQHLGVDAMSIYYHVHDKDALLGAMVDAVAAEIAVECRPDEPNRAVDRTASCADHACPPYDAATSVGGPRARRARHTHPGRASAHRTGARRAAWRRLLG